MDSFPDSSIMFSTQSPKTLDRFHFNFWNSNTQSLEQLNQYPHKSMPSIEDLEAIPDDDGDDDVLVDNKMSTEKINSPKPKFLKRIQSWLRPKEIQNKSPIAKRFVEIHTKHPRRLFRIQSSTDDEKKKREIIMVRVMIIM